MSRAASSLLQAYRRLSRRDKRDVLRAFSTLVLALAAHTILETARDATFLAELPASWLPIAYVGVAAATAITTRLTPDEAPSWALAITFAMGTGGTLVFWWLLGGSASRLLLLTLYVWPGVITTTLVVQFWLRLHRRLDVEEAKALYGFVGGGALIGALAGALAATAASRLVGPRALLLLASSLYLLGIPAALWGGSEVEDELDSRNFRLTQPSRTEDASPATRYVQGLVALTAAMTVATTFVDYAFKATLASTVSADRLAPVLAQFHVVVNAIAILAQFVLLPGLLQGSLRRAIQLLPVLMVLAGGAALAVPGLVTMLVLQGTSGALKHSVFSTATEVLFLPLRGQVRANAKRWVASIGKRGGQALASGALLLLLSVTDETRIYAGVAVFASVAAFVLVVHLHRAYLDRFRARLRERLVDSDHPALPELDVASLESLVVALSSPNISEVLAALDLLELYDKSELVPPLILHHPNRDVVLRALALLTRHRPESTKPLLPMLYRRPEPDVRAAAVRMACILGPQQARRAMAASRDDGSRDVRTTRALASFTAEALDSGAAKRDVDGLLHGDAETRTILARNVIVLPAKLRVEAGLQLADSSDESLRLELASALVSFPTVEDIPALLRLLAPDETRELARRALTRLPTAETLEALEDALEDPSTRDDIRRHLPRTISRFDHSSAAPILSRRVGAEHDERVVLKILRGLGRLREEAPQAPIQETTLRELLLSTVAQGRSHRAQLRLLRRVVAARPELDSSASTLLRSLVEHRIRRETERVFRLLHILYPLSEMNIIHACCIADERSVRATARELLRHALPRGMRHEIVALVEGAGSPFAEGSPWWTLEHTLAQEERIDVEALDGCLEELEQDRDAIVSQVARAHRQELEADVPPSGKRPRLSVVVDKLELDSFDESAREVIAEAGR